MRNIIVAVVVNMFVFVGKNANLGPGHTAKLYVHLLRKQCDGEI